MSGAELTICEVITCLPEKFILDFANGIDVARDHVRVQQSHTSFSSRLYDSFSGKAVRRQTEVNACLIEGVSGALKWLEEHSHSLAKSHYAMAQFNQRLAKIQNNVVKLANYSADTREQLKHLTEKTQLRFQQFEQELKRVDLELQAEKHLDIFLTKWKAGKLNDFSIMARSYLVLEELRWGAWGNSYYAATQSQQLSLREHLKNKLAIQLAQEANTQVKNRVELIHWIKLPELNTQVDAQAALSYLGDWCIADQHPFAYTTANQTIELPLDLPRICSADRVAQALCVEVLGAKHA